MHAVDQQNSALNRKFREIELKNLELTQQVDVSQEQVGSLQREKSFLDDELVRVKEEYKALTARVKKVEEDYAVLQDTHQIYNSIVDEQMNATEDDRRAAASSKKSKQATLARKIVLRAMESQRLSTIVLQDSLRDRAAEHQKRIHSEQLLHQVRQELQIYKLRYDEINQASSFMEFKTVYLDNLNIQLHQIVNRMELGREMQAYTQNRTVGEPSVSDVVSQRSGPGQGGGKITLKFVDRLTALQPVPKGKQKPEAELRRQDALLVKLSKDQTKQLLAMNQEALHFTSQYTSAGGLMVSQYLITQS